MILKINGNINKFIEKCLNNRIDFEILNRDSEELIIKIKNTDYKRIKKVSYYVKVKKIRNTNFKYIKDIIKKYLYDFILLLIFIIIIYLQSNIIINIEIKHENKELKSKINELLKENKITKFNLARNHEYYNKISDKILNNNRDILDFIAINRDGMKLTISLEERIIKRPQKEDNYCNIIASKESVISSIIVYKGISLVEKNQKVNIGDVLISGDIIHNEEIKKQVCADGIIKGITWYKINITMPKTEETIEYTGKNQYNISINNKMLLKNKYKLYDKSSIFKIKNISLIKLKEKKINEIKLSDEEVKNKALKKAKEELILKNGKEINIIDEKILNISNFNSKIELEIFLSVEEVVGIKKVGEESDPKQGI